MKMLTGRDNVLRVNLHKNVSWDELQTVSILCHHCVTLSSHTTQLYIGKNDARITLVQGLDYDFIGISLDAFDAYNNVEDKNNV